MATESELLVYKIFHLIRLILNIIIFLAALLFLLGGCCHNQLRTSKRQWLIFNICIAMIIFSIINSTFAMLPLAPTYLTGLAVQICTLQHFLEDVAQGQVAYSFLIYSIHQLAPQQWRNRSFIWFGICIILQWLCSYLLPLPQILMSNVYVCFGYYPIQFFPIYSLVFLLIFPVVVHLIIFLIMIILKKNETTDNQIHPMGHIDPPEIDYQLMIKYILIMALLFDIIGYGPKIILALMDLQLRESIAIYSALEILPSLCLLIDIAIFYIIHKENRKKISSICGC